MNKQNYDVLKAILQEPFINQRRLSEASGHSLGIVNRSIKSLVKSGYLDGEMLPTEKARNEYAAKATKNAVILAAGFGMRMVPINFSTPKALLEVNGEPLIERVIKALHQVGIHEITVVVGYMKEKFDYLIDEFGVELVFNPDYASKNNLSSLALVADRISNTYVIPSDIWCKKNPFDRHEFYSWYMVTDLPDNNSEVRVSRKTELVKVGAREVGNAMIGISYLSEEDAAPLRERLLKAASDENRDDDFWESALYLGEKMAIRARIVPASEVVEINTYEQLRQLDENSDQLKTDAIQVICQSLSVEPKDIVDITVLKKGMTNRSFLFRCGEKKYIMRIPGEGTGELINRAQEAQVYQTISDVRICDDISYINPHNGYKITEYLPNARVCDPDNVEDLRKCMARLRGFHEMKLRVDHTFDIFERIDFYQSLWGDIPSAYSDYQKTKEDVLSLRPFIAAHQAEYVLTHIDAVPDNFLFTEKEDDLRLIDWEYAGMQDPHVDIAMFCIYALYNKEQVDRLIDLYFTEGCTAENRIKIYCYIAACGLLWSNWCEYKRNLGVEFGEYSLRQYRYAKDYYRIVKAELERKEMA